MFNLPKKFGVKQSFIGMDIDADHIKFVEISRKKGKFQLENYAFYSFSPGWMKEFSSNLFFKGKHIVTAISEGQALSKKVILSKKLTKKEKEEYLFLEMEKMALCPMNELYMDFQMIEKAPKSNITEYLCVAVRRQTIDALIQLFQETPYQIKKIGLVSHIKEQTLKQKWLSISLNSRLHPEKWKKDAPFFMKACLLAMSFPYENKEINFLPKPKKEQKNQIILLVSLSLTIIFSYFLMSSLFLKNSTEIKPLISTVSAVVKKVPLKKTPALPARYSLKNTPIHLFKIMGFMDAMDDNSKKIWGIIKTPDGKVYHVTIGNVIGKEQAKIREISNKQIILVQKNRKYYIE